MNEEVNFCNQCGTKINSDVKFCSNCGYDLTNSSTKTTSDKTIKVEVTNVTVEKGFKAVKNLFKRKEKTPKSPKRLERQAPQHDEPEMISDVKLVLIVFAVLFLFFFAIDLF
jgi:hypothetical protein